jgi:hypothetical protein
VTINWRGSVTVYVAGLGVWVVVLRRRLFLRMGFHLVGISFRACRLIRICGRRALEVGELLHPCREGTAPALTICTVWHLGQLSGTVRK